MNRRRFARASTLLVSLAWLCPSPGHAEVAEYRVTFDASWSQTTHPSAYPVDAHFSSMIGGAHDATTSYWALGETASSSIEFMAEFGGTSILRSEVEADMATGAAFSVIRAPGLDSPGSVETTFLIEGSTPLVTLVSMVAPSPDWFVGVADLPLHDGSAWLDPVVASLQAYDAGTDSGPDFASPDEDTVPKESIATFSGPPFYGSPDLGSFTFEFVRLRGVCEDSVDNDGDGKTDYPEDPDCESASDLSEAGPPLEVPSTNRAVLALVIASLAFWGAGRTGDDSVAGRTRRE